ncbi:MAG: hypothetical protein GY810_01030 [Aureispira sp.]|nr:hypothetical protein [Aureispira sp.]
MEPKEALASVLLDTYKKQVEDIKKDLMFFIDQSFVIEHKQNHEEMRRLSEKYIN